MIGIYKITNPSNKVYIGQSWNIERRSKDYLKFTDNVKGQSRIYNSLIKYGVENHKFEIIYEFESSVKQEVLDKCEMFYIKFFKEKSLSLNIREGGKNKKASEETRILISKMNSGRKMTDKQREKLSKAKSKIISQFDKKGKKIADFESIEIAEKTLGIRNIGKVCNGKRYSAGGFIFSFKK